MKRDEMAKRVIDDYAKLRAWLKDSGSLFECIGLHLDNDPCLRASADISLNMRKANGVADDN